MWKWLASASLAVIIASTLPAAPVNASYSQHLGSSFYTNGVVKHVFAGDNMDLGGYYSDVQLTVYYDQLSATKMHVTKVVTKYWLKASGALYGGTLLTTYGGDQHYMCGSSLGDFNTLYPFNSRTKDAEGYSYVGSYTQACPFTVNGTSVYFTKYWTIRNVGDPQEPHVMGFTW